MLLEDCQTDFRELFVVLVELQEPLMKEEVVASSTGQEGRCEPGLQVDEEDEEGNLFQLSLLVPKDVRELVL